MEKPSLATPRIEQFTQSCTNTISPGKKRFHEQNRPGKMSLWSLHSPSPAEKVLPEDTEVPYPVTQVTFNHRVNCCQKPAPAVQKPPQTPPWRDTPKGQSFLFSKDIFPAFVNLKWMLRKWREITCSSLAQERLCVTPGVCYELQQRSSSQMERCAAMARGQLVRQGLGQSSVQFPAGTGAVSPYDPAGAGFRETTGAT